jgi:MTH538 TIR-like domain (DUF1863)
LPDEYTDYDAFISYSHALDGVLAPTLQREIEKFAKPWYRVRALRVFRDNASLSATPGLWTAIEEALARSRWLVVMASPEAAGSPWVDREISWWLANRSADRLLIVVTGGAFVWDAQHQTVDRATSTALPPALHDALSEEPRWVDLRWLREVAHVDRSNPRLRECVADIAATIRGEPKDRLVGEHIRYHRKAMRLARAGVTVLVMLVIVSVVATVVAFAQRSEALEQARLATARQLAATSVASVDTQVDLAQLLAVEAYRTAPTPQTRAALFRSVTASPHLVRHAHVGESVTALTASAARVAVAGTAGGELIHWDLSTRAVERTRVGDTPIKAVAVTPDGRRVVATNGDRTVVWDTDGDRPFVDLEVPHAQEVAISPSGRFAAVFSQAEVPRQGLPESESEPVLTLMDGRTGAVVRQVATDQTTALALPDEATLVRVNGGGAWERLSTGDLTRMAFNNQMYVPVGAHSAGVATSGSFYGVVAGGGVRVVDTRSTSKTANGGPEDLDARVPMDTPERIAVSDSGDYLAAAGGGSFVVARVAANADGKQEGLITLSGRGPAEAVAFVGEGTELVSAAGGVLSLWDIEQPAELSTARIAVPASYTVGGPSKVALTRDGDRVAMTTNPGFDDELPELSVGPFVADLTGRERRVVPLGERYEDQLPLWNPDGSRLFLVGDGGATTVVIDGAVRARWPSHGSARVVAGQVTPDGTQIVLVDQNGGVQIRDAVDGAVTRSIQGWIAPGTDELQYGVAAIGTDGAAVAYVVRGETAGAAFLVDVESGERRRLTGAGAEAVAFGDDVVLVQREDDALEVWDGRGASRLRTYTSDIGYASALAAIPGTGLLARLRGNGELIISEVDSGEVLGSFPLPPAPRSFTADPWLLTTLTSVPQTKQLVTATPGGQLVTWQFSVEAWIRIACESAGRSLTDDEWRRHVGTEAPEDLECSRK